MQKSDTFAVYDFCTACAAEIACEEIALEERAADAILAGARCNGCGEWLRERGYATAGTRSWSTSTARFSITQEYFLPLLDYCQRKAKERRDAALLGLHPGTDAGGERDQF